MDQRHWSLNQCQGSWDEHHCLTVVAQRKIVSVELLWWHSEILQLLSHARWTQCKCLGVDCIWFWPLVTIMKHFSQSVSHTFVLQGTCEPHATPFLVLYLLKLPGDSEVVLGCDCVCAVGEYKPCNLHICAWQCFCGCCVRQVKWQSARLASLIFSLPTSS